MGQHGQMAPSAQEEDLRGGYKVFKLVLEVGRGLDIISANEKQGQKGQQVPVIVAEPEVGRYPASQQELQLLRQELLQLGGQNPLTASVKRILFHQSLPVDTRHNVKINREQLAEWAARQ